MSMLRALSTREHNYCRTGEFVKIGKLTSDYEATELRCIEERYMMEREFRGIIVDGTGDDNVFNVYMQDCTFRRNHTFVKNKNRCNIFSKRICSYNRPVTWLPQHTSF